MILIEGVPLVATPADWNEITRRFEGHELFAAIMAWNLAVKMTAPNRAIDDAIDHLREVDPDDEKELAKAVGLLLHAHNMVREKGQELLQQTQQAREGA
jgi:hypothetical protein